MDSSASALLLESLPLIAKLCQRCGTPAVPRTEITLMNTLSTIKITGPDAFEFLQGQLTIDLLKLSPEESRLSAWCNPKGRVICLMDLSKTAEGYDADVATDLSGEIVKRLMVFRFRSKVEFEILSAESDVDMVDRIKTGVPWIGLQQSELFTPHMLNLDLLGAVSVDKGCYTGQEIIARTHYKGSTKRRAMRFKSDKPVAVGDKVSLDDRDIGEVLNVSGNDLLAVVPVSSSGDALSVRGVRLKLCQLPYL